MNMRLNFLLFFTVFFCIYAAVNYYIGLRVWQAFGGLVSPLAGKVYWLALAVMSLTYFISRFAGDNLPDWLGSALEIAGSYWLALLFYAFLVLVVADFFRFMDRWLAFLPGVLKQNTVLAGLGIMAVVAAILAYGAWNARTTVIKQYAVNIDKPAGAIMNIHAVVVSDLHLGSIVNRERLKKLIEMINQRHPDIVLLPGDIIEQPRVFREQGMGELLRSINARYGVFAVPGNHEYIGGMAEEDFSLLRESGINLLRDEYVMIADSFYVVGRDDLAGKSFMGKSRKELVQVMEGVDKSLPVILMDHQPYRLEEAQKNGVDLQLSGHTHHGQLFPLNFITGRIFEVDQGYLRKGDLNVIVSVGYGTWGPPVRLGSKSEILELEIRVPGI
jgi:predicted MPP superfamily phosphohydrolase